MSRVLPPDNVCEILFQMHKNENHSVPWIKDTYKGKPKNIDTAKEILIQRGIIHSKTKGNIKTTYLNSEYFEVASYEEAKRMIDVAKHKPSDISTTTGTGMAMAYSQAVESARKPATRRSKTTGTKHPQKTIRSKPRRSGSKNLLTTISVILAILFIGYIMWRLGWI
jgi:hypothetical protein